MSPKKARISHASPGEFSDSVCVGLRIVVAEAMNQSSKKGCKKGVLIGGKTQQSRPQYTLRPLCIASCLHAMDMVADAKTPRRSTTSSASLCTSYL
jgi:hypothetical protein